MIGVVEREKAVAITALFAPQKVTEEIATPRGVSVEWVIVRSARWRLSPRASEEAP